MVVGAHLQVTWRRGDEVHPLTIGLFPFVADSRIAVDYNQRTSEWSLIIQDVRPTDEGVYHCQISTKSADNDNSYDVLLNVKGILLLISSIKKNTASVVKQLSSVTKQRFLSVNNGKQSIHMLIV